MRIEETKICLVCDEVFYAGNQRCTNCHGNQVELLEPHLVYSKQSTALLKKLVVAVKNRLFTITNKEHDAIAEEAVTHLKKGGN